MNPAVYELMRQIQMKSDFGHTTLDTVKYIQFLLGVIDALTDRIETLERDVDTINTTLGRNV